MKPPIKVILEELEAAHRTLNSAYDKVVKRFGTCPASVDIITSITVITASSNEIKKNIAAKDLK